MRKKFNLALVLEDEPVSREIVKSIAQKHAAEVVAVASVKQAKTLLDGKAQPDLVIADCLLDDGSPFSYLKSLSVKRTLLISADPDSGEKQDYPLLLKPFTEEQLEKEIYNESGFTLVEILAVVTLVALMFSMTFGVITSISTAKKNIEIAHKNLRTAQNLFSRLNKELSTAQAIPLSGSKNNYMESTGSSGVNALSFTTASGAIDTGQELFNAGMIQVTYELVPASEKDVYHLTRTELPGGITDKDTQDAVFEARKLEVTLAKNVIDLNFRFFHENQWKSDWEERNKLPDAVEIAISLKSDGETVETWKSAVSLLRSE